MLPLNDKKALVTGASGEIGAEIARKLHTNPYRLGVEIKKYQAIRV